MHPLHHSHTLSSSSSNTRPVPATASCRGFRHPVEPPPPSHAQLSLSLSLCGHDCFYTGSTLYPLTFHTPALAPQCPARHSNFVHTFEHPREVVNRESANYNIITLPLDWAAAHLRHSFCLCQDSLLHTPTPTHHKEREKNNIFHSAAKTIIIHYHLSHRNCPPLLWNERRRSS